MSLGLCRRLKMDKNQENAKKETEKEKREKEKRLEKIFNNRIFGG